MSLVSKVMSGMGIIGSIMTPAATEAEFENKVQLMSHTLGGLHDELILCALFANITKNVPTDLDEVKANGDAAYGLERLKDMIRSDFKKIIEKGIAEDKNNLLMKMKDTNKPHPMGTINEIAAKLNISKSEVRRLKSNGTLDSMVMLTSPN